MPPKTDSSPGERPRAPSEASRHSRDSSTASGRHISHAPTTPSQLREVHVPAGSPETSIHHHAEASSTSAHVEFGSDGIQPPPGHASAQPVTGEALTEEPHGILDLDSDQPVRNRLLNHQNWDAGSCCGTEECTHGTMSPRPFSIRSYGTMNSAVSSAGFGGLHAGSDSVGETSDPAQALLPETITDGLLGGNGKGKKVTPTRYLAERHGVKNRRMMYLQYYVPVINWARQYRWRYFTGDLVAAISMASFYIPMSLSYASNLAHLPPIHGLYAFAINPLIYGILGSCPQMVVGPEAPGSLLVGEVVRDNIKKGKVGDEDGILEAQIAGMVTCMAGAFIFIGGLFRLGFLDNVLSRPFLRGFISAIGVVIFIDQAIPEMGLARIAAKEVAHGSALDKVVFLVRNIPNAHKLTTAVSFSAFAIIMVSRELKKRLQPRYPNVAYVPDRFVVVVVSAILAWHFNWADRGLAILGDVKASGSIFQIHFPFDVPHLRYVSDAINTALIISMLGFFESSVAGKSLGSGDRSADRVHLQLSPNRELIALGTSNVVGGLFMALPAFGGYGRSKVNASTGGTTPMSSVLLSLITIFCTIFMLPYFHYLPKGVLCAMVSVVAYSLVEEAPHDIRFFWRIRAWSELILMGLIFTVTIFWDLKRGIAVGIGLSILRLIRHSTRPRIQILGRVPGTTDQFANAEWNAGNVEFIEGCLIVKIPEPLTFANTGELKNRLRRLEDHGTNAAHPALPRIRREEHNKNIIFDVHGVTSLDGAGAQVLSEIVEGYVRRGVRVYFCRVPSERSDVWRLFESTGIVDAVGGERHFVKSVHEALRMTELERMSEGIGENGA